MNQVLALKSSVHISLNANQLSRLDWQGGIVQFFCDLNFRYNRKNRHIIQDVKKRYGWEKMLQDAWLKAQDKSEREQYSFRTKQLNIEMCNEKHVSPHMQKSEYSYLGQNYSPAQDLYQERIQGLGNRIMVQNSH